MERYVSAESLKRKLEFEETVSAICTRFVNMEDFHEAVNLCLRDMGRLSGASRVYVFLFRKGGRLMDNTHEWCAPGVTPQKDNLQCLPSEMFPWWIGKLTSGEVICVEDVGEMPPEAAMEQQLLLSQEIYAVLCLPIKVDGELVGFVGLDNVTNARRWSDDNLALLHIFAEVFASSFAKYRTVEKLRLAEDARERAWARFVQIAAHELRNPMAAIKSVLALLQAEAGHDYQGAGELAEVIRLLEREVDRLSGLVEEVLTAFRLQEGQLVLRYEKVNLIDIVQTALKPFEMRPDIPLNIDVNCDSAFVWGDYVRLEEVVRNLVSNAVKYSSTGQQVFVQLSTEGDNALIIVRDFGIGIPAGELDRIFERFYRIQQPDGHDPGGFGLGLYISKDIVDRHGGQIWAESEEEKGTTFYVKLPLCE